MLVCMTDKDFRKEALDLIDEKKIGNNVIETRTEGLAKISPDRYQKVWASEISHMRKGARVGMNPKKVRALERILGVPEGTLGQLLGFTGPYEVREVGPEHEGRTEDELIAEALGIPTEEWEALPEDEQEYILKDARDKIEFFLRRKGGK